MQNLQIHFSHRDSPDRSLAPGVHRLVRMANGVVDLSQEVQGVRLVAQLCIDRRGVWLQVADGIRGVHVNGRPVRTMAPAWLSSPTWLGRVASQKKPLARMTPGQVRPMKA